MSPATIANRPPVDLPGKLGYIEQVGHAPHHSDPGLALLVLWARGVAV